MKRKNVSWVFLLGLVVSAGACGGFGSAPSDPTSDAGTDSAPPPSLSADPRLFLKVLPVAPQKLVVGSRLNFQVRVERNGFEGDVELTVRNAPKDVSVVSAKLRTESEGTLELSAPETAQTQPVKVDLVAITSLGNVQVSFDLDIRGAFGTLDKSFGGGVVYLPTALDGPGARQRVESATLLPDGSVSVMTGERLFRLGANGVIDATFVGLEQVGLSLVVTKAGGFQFLFQDAEQKIGVRRLNRLGGLDLGWNDTGTVSLPTLPGPPFEATLAAAMDDGGAVVTGKVVDETSKRVKFCFLRFDATGKYDAAWSGGVGVACSPEIDFGESVAAGYAEPVYLQVAGSRVESLWTQSFSQPPKDRVGRLMRLSSNGMFDATYGSGGIRVVPFPYFFAYPGASATSQGEVMFAGHTTDNPPSLAVVRLTASGTLDSSWGSTGAVLLAGKASTGAFPAGTAVDAAGRYYAPYVANAYMGFYRVGRTGQLEPAEPVKVSIPDAVPQQANYSTETRALVMAPNECIYVIASGKRAAIARVWL